MVLQSRSADLSDSRWYSSYQDREALGQEGQEVCRGSVYSCSHRVHCLHGRCYLFDVLSATCCIDHNSVKWYRRIFYWVLNVACINGWVLYKHHCSQLAVPVKERLDPLEFVSQC